MKTNKLPFKKALELINNSNRVLLTMHEGPDGDDLGSLLAMRYFLKQLGKEPTAIIKGDVPDNLSFLPDVNVIKQDIDHLNFDLVIFFGCNLAARTGFKQLENLKLSSISFDHHPDNQEFAIVNVVDPETSAVAELVYYFLEFADAELTKEMATCLLTEEDLREIGATDEDLDGFVELLNNMPQSRFALLLRQDGDVVRGSLRSEPQKKVDVSKIAKSFGGGGHKLASGFKIKGKLKKEGDAWSIQ